MASEDAKPSEDKLQDVEHGDERSLIYVGARIKTAEDLLKHAQIDMRIWEIERQIVNMWEVTGKKSLGQGHDRRWLGDKLWANGNLQIKVWLKRRAPKVIQDGILELIQGWKPNPVIKKPKIMSNDKYLLAMHLSDLHFGKRCWDLESGNNYDLKIADAVFRAAFDDLLFKCLKYAPNIDRVIFPIGNDFFHVNDWKSRTANETRVDSTDDRFPKVFATGVDSVVYAIEKLAAVCPAVDVEWVPGNHDPHTSWHLAFLLQYAFRNVGHIKVTINQRARKYYRYGCTLAGMTHGEVVKEVKLPTLMASEAGTLLDSGVKFREWWLGHLHKSKEVEFCTEDSQPNATIRRIPSLCGTDGWHDQQGYTGTYKMAEAWLYSHDRGPEARFLTHA